MRWTVVLALLVIAGCGGGPQKRAQPRTPPAETTAIVSQPTPSKAEFITRADAVCAAMHKRLRPWQKRADAASDLGSMLEPASRIAPLAAEMSRRLDALPTPTAEAATIDHYRALVRRQASDIRQIVAAVRSRNLARVLRLSQTNRDYIARQRGIAEGLGLKVCGH